MPANIREIKGRIRAVGNIQRITKTMQMIATARFQAMQKRATSAQQYTRKIAEIVGELTASAGGDEELSHPLLAPPADAADRSVLLVIASNRGLCGAYNANVLRQARHFINDRRLERVAVEAVGKKANGYFRFNQIPLQRFHSHIGDKPAFEDVERLAEVYMELFRSGQVNSVHVAYTAFESMSRQVPQVMRLLPLEAPQAEGEGQPGGASVLYEFSPDAESLLDELLPETVMTRLFQCFNESVVSEQLARMVAMKAATDAAGKMKKALSRQYNRARQATITTELSEIIAGATALE